MFLNLTILLLSLTGSIFAMAQTSEGEKKFIEAVEDELDANKNPSSTSKNQKKVLIRKKAVEPAQVSDSMSESESVEMEEDTRGPKRHQFLIPDRQYGQYKLRLAMMRPEFDGDVNFYEDLYGNVKWYPNIMVDWIPWDGPVGLGVGFRFGYYSDRGHAVRSAPTAGQPLVVDKNQETRLRLYPMQIVLAGQFSPFSQKWIGVDGWIGYEHLFYTETRLGSKTSTSSNDLYVNEGSNQNLVYGGAVNILLNPLDEHSIAVMNRGLGVGYVYLTYIFEVAKALKDDSKNVDLSRTSQGIALSFESSL